MFDPALVGRTLGSGYVLLICDYAWNQHGAFCRLVECGNLSIFGGETYSAVLLDWLVIGNRPVFEDHQLVEVEVPEMGCQYWGEWKWEGSSYSRTDPNQLTKVMRFANVIDALPEAFSYIGLHHDSLDWAVKFASQKLHCLAAH